MVSGNSLGKGFPDGELIIASRNCGKRQMKDIIDIHTHITPGVDDGAEDMEMSLEMLRIEAKQGCKKVLLTPHGSAFGWYGPENKNYTYEQMKRVQKEAAREGIPIQVFTGCEINTTQGNIDAILQDLNDGRLPSMNHTRYVMAEFSTYEGTMDDAKYCLTRYLEEGWIPIIAHAERYCRTFTTVENIRTLKKLGCLVQANYYDLDEEHDEEIRTCTQSLVEAELVDMMGSDAHRTGHRPPKLVRGARYIRENCREEYAEDILWRNAEKYLKL